MTEQPPHPSTDLNDVVHQRARLGILSVLTETREADFSYLRTALQLTDGNLSRHIDVLAGEGLVTVRKGHEGRRPRTWVSITRLGAAAYAAEIAALRQLVDRFEHHPPTPDPPTPPIPAHPSPPAPDPHPHAILHFWPSLNGHKT